MLISLGLEAQENVSQEGVKEELDEVYITLRELHKDNSMSSYEREILINLFLRLNEKRVEFEKIKKEKARKEKQKSEEKEMEEIVARLEAQALLEEQEENGQDEELDYSSSEAEEEWENKEENIPAASPLKRYKGVLASNSLFPQGDNKKNKNGLEVLHSHRRPTKLLEQGKYSQNANMRKKEKEILHHHHYIIASKK
jgi:hypothetical protein